MTDETDTQAETPKGTVKSDAAATKQPQRTRPVIRPRAKPTAPEEKQEPTLAADPIEPVSENTEQAQDSPKADSFSATRDPEDAPSTKQSSVSDRDWQTIIKRIAFMIIAGFLCGFAFYVAVCLVILQALVVIISDEPNEQIKDWIIKLSTYVKDVFTYLSYQSDEKPFPLNSSD